MNTLNITVTKKDIIDASAENDTRYNPTACPIARAVRRLTKAKQKKKGVYINPGMIWVGEKKYTVPAAARRFIYKFDRRQDVKPFRFQAKRWELIHNNSDNS